MPLCVLFQWDCDVEQFITTCLNEDLRGLHSTHGIAEARSMKSIAPRECLCHLHAFHEFTFSRFTCSPSSISCVHFRPFYVFTFTHCVNLHRFHVFTFTGFMCSPSPITCSPSPVSRVHLHRFYEFTFTGFTCSPSPKIIAQFFYRSLVLPLCVQQSSPGSNHACTGRVVNDYT